MGVSGRPSGCAMGLTCHKRVPILNHRETSAKLARWEANPTKNECGLPDLVTAQAKVDVKDAPKTLPDVLVVRSFVPLHSVRVHETDLVFGACNCTVGGATTTLIARLAPWGSVQTGTVAPQSRSGGAVQRKRHDRAVFPSP